MTTSSEAPGPAGPDAGLSRMAAAISESSLGTVPDQDPTPWPPLPDLWLTLTVTTFRELLARYRDRREMWGEDHDTAVDTILADIDTHSACEGPA